MQPAPGNAHVLVVDDEPAITDLLATALRYMGYQVTTAATASPPSTPPRRHRRTSWSST